VDKIEIRDLALRTFVGIYPHEKEKKQDVVLNITLEADLSKAGKSDDISDTVDYKTVKNQIVEWVESSQFNLVEHLAEGTAALCLKHAGVKKVIVTVDKPGALRYARSVAVTIERTADG